jgi:hypothetical protein
MFVARQSTGQGPDRGPSVRGTVAASTTLRCARRERLAGITSMPPDACPCQIPTGLAVHESEILGRDKAAISCSPPSAVQER